MPFRKGEVHLEPTQLYVALPYHPDVPGMPVVVESDTIDMVIDIRPQVCTQKEEVLQIFILLGEVINVGVPRTIFSSGVPNWTDIQIDTHRSASLRQAKRIDWSPRNT